MKFTNIIIRFSLPFLLFSCSGYEKSEYNKLRKQNAKGEYIYRKSADRFFSFKPPEKKEKKAYPWEVIAGSDLTKLSKHHFRCKGNSLNPSYSHEDKSYQDCKGSFEHGLPFIEDKEGVYPTLVNLLNFIQAKTKKEVVITTGHRCPKHNSYADPFKDNLYSKHQIGAEVDFYVKGLENSPEKIIDLLISYYEDDPDYKKFSRYSGKTNVSIQPWMNKEIFIKLVQKQEGRDFDNQHQYPYITIQVRYDKDRDIPVTYSWEKAHSRYKRTM